MPQGSGFAVFPRGGGDHVPPPGDAEVGWWAWLIRTRRDRWRSWCSSRRQRQRHREQIAECVGQHGGLQGAAQIRFLEALPRPHGKLLKRILRDQAAALKGK